MQDRHDVMGGKHDCHHALSSRHHQARRNGAVKYHEKGRNRTNIGTQSFRIRYPAWCVIFVLVLSRNEVGVAAQETSLQIGDERWLQDGNVTADEAQLDIPGNFGMASYETVEPTAASTAAPTATPLPSATPSSEPSVEPSGAPSSVPSTSPTMFPTVTPMPTEKPSSTPTDQPSASPSELPSASPSLSCHDVASYRSPINNFTCEDHANTDCTKWRHLGLNDTHLQELVENCPIACKVPCGYFTTLDTNISFVISNVPGLIDDFMSREPLEETTRDYLTDYILEKSPITKFSLTQVNLLFQEPLNSTVSARMNDMSQRRLGTPGLRRSLQNETLVSAEDYIHLQVRLNLQGFKIYPIKIVLTDLLLAGIDSPGYTAQLRLSDSFYSNATASSAAQATPRVVEPEPPSEEKNSSPAMVGIITVLVVVMVIVAAVLYKKHARLRKCKRELPREGEIPQESTGSLRGNIFSFDLSPASSTGVAGRLLAVFSSDGSRNSTSPSSTEESAPSAQSKSTTDDHPLTGVIPPMLVIDNIEQPSDYEDSMRSIPEVINTKKTKAVVPTKRMEASASFIEALNNGQAGNHDSASTFPEFMYSVSSLTSATPQEYSARNLISPGHRALAAVLSGDVTVPDDSSVSSTPIKGTDMEVDLPPRRTLSSGQLADDVDVEEALDEFMKSQQWGQDDDTSSEEDVSPIHRKIKSASYDDSPTKSHRRPKDRSSTWDKGSFPRPSIADAKTVKRGSTRKVTRGISTQSSRTSSRNSGQPSPTHRRTDSRNGSRGSHSSGDLFASDGECFYIFEASHRGYLGLAIEPCRRGTRIQAVKDHSPLFGLVEPGDRIVEIDGVETTYKTTAGVAEMLRRKKGRNKKIRLTIARTNSECGAIPALPTMTRSRSKSSGSIALRSPSPANPIDYSGFSPKITDLDSSYTDMSTPTGTADEQEEAVPFHYIGAAPSEDPGLEDLSDLGY